MTERQGDNYWFNEILRIEKENPYSLRTPDNEHDINCTNSRTEEQVDDYFAIDDRRAYLAFIKNHKTELSKESFLWLYEDLPCYVDEEFRMTGETANDGETVYAAKEEPCPFGETA